MNKFISISENEYNSLNQEIIWNSLSNLNLFTTQGIYNIYGERIRYSDNLPTNDINSTFSARLTVLDSSTNNREDVSNKHITLILSLSNRLGNDLVYIRTGRGSSLDTLLWESWATLQKNINVGLIKSLDGLVNNGIYSGILNLDNNHYLSFACMVINDYSIKQSPKRIVQFMYGLDNNNGDTIFKYRVKTDNIWDNWHLVNESDILNVVNTEVNKILDGTSPEKIQNIRNIITWIEEHGPNSSEIITQIQTNQEQISIEKQRAKEAEEDLINRIKGVSYHSNAKTDPFVCLFAGNAKELKFLLESTTDSGRYRINFGDAIHIDLNVWKKNNGNIIQCIKGFIDLYEDAIDVSEEYNVFLRKGIILNDILNWDIWVCIEGSNIQIKLEAEINRAEAAERVNTAAIEAETVRAIAEEQANAAAIAEERIRAEAEEQAIRQLISDLIGESPETLDTIHEISSWILNDEIAAAAMTTQINKNTEDIEIEKKRVNDSLDVLIEHDKVVRPVIVLLNNKLGDLSLGLKKKGDTANVSFTITAKKGGEDVEAPVIKVDGIQLYSNEYQGSTTEDTTYNVEVRHTYTIASRETTEVVLAKAYITFVEAMYFGFAGEIISSSFGGLVEQTLTTSPAGSYSLTNRTNNYMWLCVPDSMTIKKVTMDGFDVPVELIDNAPDGYNCYRSSNELVEGTYNIVIS